jgi:hypothetical protein
LDVFLRAIPIRDNRSQTFPIDITNDNANCLSHRPSLPETRSRVNRLSASLH